MGLKLPFASLGKQEGSSCLTCTMYGEGLCLSGLGGGAGNFEPNSLRSTRHGGNSIGLQSSNTEVLCASKKTQNRQCQRPTVQLSTQLGEGPANLNVRHQALYSGGKR